MSPTIADATSALPLEDNTPHDDDGSVTAVDPATATQETKKVDELEAFRVDARRRPSASMDDSYLLQLRSASVADHGPPARGFVRRTQSCGGYGRTMSAHRVRINYHDEQLRARCERNAQELLEAAFDDASAGSNTSILARKALRYRRILQRMEENQVDVHDPAFNASACLGVEWHHVASD